jgi:hypothetical protein
MKGIDSVDESGETFSNDGIDTGTAKNGWKTAYTRRNIGRGSLKRFPKHANSGKMRDFNQKLDIE